MDQQILLTLTADIVSAHVSNNPVTATDLPIVIGDVHQALGALGRAVTPDLVQSPPQKPAVSIKASIKPDYIVCLEDGIQLKMLKRHLMTHHGMTPDQYRSKWSLPSDYPLTAPNYASVRSDIAKKSGLGKSKVAKAAEAPQIKRGKGRPRSK